MTDAEHNAAVAEYEALKDMADNDPERYANEGMSRMRSAIAGLHRSGPGDNVQGWNALLSLYGSLPVKQ